MANFEVLPMHAVHVHDLVLKCVEHDSHREMTDALRYIERYKPDKFDELLRFALDRSVIYGAETALDATLFYGADLSAMPVSRFANMKRNFAGTITTLQLHGWDINRRDSDTSWPLMYYAAKKNDELLQLCLQIIGATTLFIPELQADPNSAVGIPPVLEIALSEGTVTGIKLLLEAGAPLSDSVLDIAVKHAFQTPSQKRLDVVKFVVEELGYNVVLTGALDPDPEGRFPELAEYLVVKHGENLKKSDAAHDLPGDDSKMDLD